MNLKLICQLSMVGLLFSTSLAFAADEPKPETPEFDPAAMQAAMKEFHSKPDNVGTGPFPALKEMDSSLPDHVVYRPQNLAALGEQKLGVLAWGNGGCSPDGAGGRFHLTEIASHGYLAIANGKILSGPGAPPSSDQPNEQARNVARQQRDPNAPRNFPPPATRSSQLIEAIDWALSENAREGSPYYGRIDPSQIAVGGWSCGGLQALEVAKDPRVATVMVHNSGIFKPGMMNSASGMDIGKDTLKTLHTPVIYLIGGPTDIAYANAVDDYERINTVPVMMANLDVGHGGTFIQENGGRVAPVAVSWLNWQLRGDQNAAKLFVGPNCGLCVDADWDVKSKRLDQ